MKLLCILLLLPMLGIAQLHGRQDDSLRKIADTMHYPSPFRFMAHATTSLGEAELFQRCYEWLVSVKDSLPGMMIKKDTIHNKIMASNVPATADISNTIAISIKGNKYTITLQDYIYHTVNGKRIPVETAAVIEAYKDPCNIEKVIIVHNYPLIFSALADYVR